MNNINKLKQYYINNIKQCISDLKTKGKRIKQLPNILTASRIVAPLFIVPCALTGNLMAAVVFTISFALTDFFDGILARKLNATSDFGKELDPIADKFFVGGILIPLIKYNPTIILNLLLELSIAAINSSSKIKGNNPKTNLIGKIKTWSLSSYMVANYYTLFLPLNKYIFISLFAATTLLQVGSASKYLIDDIKKDKQKKIINTDLISQDEEKLESSNKTSRRKKTIEVLKSSRNILANTSKEVYNQKKSLHK